MDRIKGKLTYANVMASVAVFLAFGGGAYAVKKNSVGSKQIKANAVKSKHVKNNNLKSKDLKDNQVSSADLKDGTIGSEDIADDVVTGAKVDESSLGEVPTAAFAAGTNVRAAASDGTNINIAGNNGNQTARSVTIDAPVAGTLLIRGGLRPDNNGGDDIYTCDLLLDGGLLGASSRGSVMTDDVGAGVEDDNSCETSAGPEVTAGEHTVDLRANGVGAGNEIEDASLQVLFVPAS